MFQSRFLYSWIDGLSGLLISGRCMLISLSCIMLTYCRSLYSIMKMRHSDNKLMMRKQHSFHRHVPTSSCHIIHSRFVVVESRVRSCSFNTLRPRQRPPFSRRHFQMDFLEWNVWISINNSLKFVHRGPINNIPTLVQVMAWRRPGDKPLSELMMVRLLTHICVTRPQWVNIETFCATYIHNFLS